VVTSVNHKEMRDFFMGSSRPVKVSKQYVDELDAEKGRDDSADTVDQRFRRSKAAAPKADSALRAEPADQCNDDQGVEDDCRQDRGFRCAQVHHVQRVQHRKCAANIAGMMAKYSPRHWRPRRFERAARDEQLLADFDDLNELGGVGSRSTMFPASFAACVPVFMANADIGLRQRWGVILPSTRHGHELPLLVRA